MKIIMLSLLSLILTACAGAPVNTETSTNLASMEAPLLIVKLAPMYPTDAYRNGIEGYVVVEFTVNERGRTENITVIDSNPEIVFDQVAIKAAEKFLYKPQKDTSGKAVAVSGVSNKFTFDLSKARKVN